MVVLSIGTFVEFHFIPFQLMAPHNHQAEDLTWRIYKHIVCDIKSKNRRQGLYINLIKQIVENKKKTENIEKN